MNLWHKSARLANHRLVCFRGRFIFLLSPLLSSLGRLIATLTAAFIVGRPNSSLREGQSRRPSAHPCDDRDSRLGRAERLQREAGPIFLNYDSAAAA